MKKLLISVLVISIVGFVMYCCHFLLGDGLCIPTRVDTSFAKSASMRCEYGDKDFDVVITDKNDIKTLKGILDGFAFYDNHNGPPCMTDISVSITLTDGRKNIAFCPDYDGGTLVYVDSINKYLNLSGRQRRALDSIFKKHGVIFPL